MMTRLHFYHKGYRGGSGAGGSGNPKQTAPAEGSGNRTLSKERDGLGRIIQAMLSLIR